MPDYKLSKIYKIEPIDADQIDKVYVGSTTQRLLSSTWEEHKYKFDLFLKEQYPFALSFDIFLTESPEFCRIVLLENYPCDNEEQLFARERYWINKLNSTNRYWYMPGRIKEIKEQYLIDHSDRIKLYFQK